MPIYHRSEEPIILGKVLVSESKQRRVIKFLEHQRCLGHQDIAWTFRWIQHKGLTLAKFSRASLGSMATLKNDNFRKSVN
jgi:hypothetical protein